jgi:hypothetical protein
LRIRPARFALCVAVALLSGRLQLADFVAVCADSCFPLRASIDVASAGDQGLQRVDALSFRGGCPGGNASGGPCFNPCLPQGPRKALTANVRKLDLRIAIGLAEDRPRATSYGKPVLVYDLKCVGSEAYLKAIG